MSSLKERIELLEGDLTATPMRIATSHDVPYAVLRYSPTDEWVMRREIRLLTTRLEATGKTVVPISLADLLWESIQKSEGLEAVVELERDRGYVEAQNQLATYLSDEDWCPLAKLIEEKLDGYDPATTIAFLLRVSSMSPGSRAVTKKAYFANRQLELLCGKMQRHPEVLIGERQRKRLIHRSAITDFATSLVSYAVGCVVGRWDIRLAFSDDLVMDQPEPFSSFPLCPPGMLQRSSDGLPVAVTPQDYMLHIDWDGITVDDAQHQDDIVGRIREILELIWKERSEIIEKEACEIIGVKTLRDYFRKPVRGGFWNDHLQRYSKSRRKAPIYWLLQSSKKNYALWLYYHRLDKDMLFKALLNYVEPKIQREENRLTELRSQKSSAGESGKGAKKLDREIEKQEDLLAELRDFEEKLRKVAELHLAPDLNDGVVLNIAPLHELVPWKEAKKYWDELLEGNYEWSSIGKQLREKGLVKG